MAFRGFPPAALEFYEGLEADNSKTYWTANKELYEQTVHAPMVELLAELEPEFGASKVFRPYRDVRFSADKSPYKTNIGATLAAGGYVQFSAQGLAAGCGMWMMSPGQLDSYRHAVVAAPSGDELQGIIDAIERRQIDVGGHNSLKTVPRGYPKDHPRAHLLRHKGLAAWKEWPPGPWLGKAGAKQRVVEFLHTAAPLHQWLATYVGSSDAMPD